MLVLDVADDLLDDVLERDEALHLAIFVDHDGEVALALEEGVELVRNGARVRHEPRRQQYILDVDLRRIAIVLLKCREEVLGVENANDVVRRVLPNRDPRVAALQNGVDDILRVFLDVEHGHLGAVNHDVGDLEVLHGEDA